MKRTPGLVAVGSFAAFALLAVVAVGIITSRAVAAGRAERAARARAEREESVRLALWRMDSAVAAIIATENARAPQEYASGGSSPLLEHAPPFARLHFRLDRGGLQAPATGASDSARAAAAQRDLELLAPRLSRSTLARAMAKKAEQAEAVIEAASSFERVAKIGSSRAKSRASKKKKDSRVSKFSSELQRKGEVEFGARAQKVKEAFSYNSAVQQRQTELQNQSSAEVMAPVWLDDLLLLVREVETRRGPVLQGVWLDWEKLEASLLEAADDLLPGSSLVPRAPAAGNQARLLASLPVELVPGHLAEPYSGGPNPWTLVIVVAWLGVVVAIVAFGVLLRGAVALSERRATFVSAVTHELRTPLTTFRMYTEMLSSGMVAEEKQGRYLETLRREAVRLGHLVENVLAYARLEKGNQAVKREWTTIGDFLERVAPRLEDRVATAHGTWRFDPSPASMSAGLHADLMAIEQVLFNLVDNASKYGSSESGLQVEFRVRLGRETIRFEVEDWGPGVPKSERERLFRPFTKSAAQAANSAPGVGLGLALSRQLAREHDGSLKLETAQGGRGACFVLTLRQASAP